jgi:MYXO-CTERM domain-containing protein
MPEQDPRRGWPVTPRQIMAERLTSSGWALPGPVGDLAGVLKRRLSGDADGLGRGADDWLEWGGPGRLGGGPATMMPVRNETDVPGGPIGMERRSMTFLSCRRTVLAVVFLLAALVAVVSPSVALAQAPAGQTVQAPPATRTGTRDDDDSGKWGLLGLLGLVGLAGLLRRDKARSVTVADRPDRR